MANLGLLSEVRTSTIEKLCPRGSSNNPTKKNLNMHDTTEQTLDDQAVSLSQARHAICLQAVWELDALCRALPDLVPMKDHTSPYFVVRGICARLLSLSGSLLTALDDETVSDAELHLRVLLEKGGA